MSEGAISSVGVIAESLSCQVNRPQNVEMIAQDGQLLVEQVLRQAKTLMEVSNSKKFTVEMLNDVLRANRIKALYGYSKENTIKPHAIPQPDGSVLYAMLNPKVSLHDVCKQSTEPKNRELPFTMQYKIVLGKQVDENGQSYNEKFIQKGAPSATFSDATAVEEGSGISGDLANYYSEIISIIEGQDPEALRTFIDMCPNDAQTESIIPYIIQYIMACIAQKLNNFDFMYNVARATLSITKSRAIPLELYIHPLFKIGFCLINKTTTTGTTEEDRIIREIGGQIIGQLVRISQTPYPGVLVEVYNRLINVIYSTSEPKGAIYGSICALLQLDDPTFASTAQHLRILMRSDGRVGRNAIEMIHERAHLCLERYLDIPISQKCAVERLLSDKM